MRPAAPLFLLLLASLSTPLVSQTSGAAPPPPESSPAPGSTHRGAPLPLQLVPQPAGCPVSFSAQRYGLVATLRETGSEPAASYTQSLKLALDRRAAAKIARIAVTVHGTNGTPQMVSARSAPTPDLTESFVFERENANASLRATQLLVTRSLPLVNRIEITEIDFADGSTWHTSTGSACSVAPSPLVLVDASAN